MPQLPDFTKNYSSTLGWSELCTAAEVILRNDLEAWLLNHEATNGVEVSLYSLVSNDLEPILVVGRRVGKKHLVRLKHGETKQSSVSFFGTESEETQNALIQLIDHRLVLLASAQSRLIAADIFKSSPVIMYQAAEIGGRWVLTQANDALGEFTGVDRNDFIGTQAKHIVTDFVHPDDVAKLVSSYDFTRTTSRQMTLQYRLRNKEGTYLPVTERVQYANSQEQKRCVAVIWHRELDQVDSEQQFQIFKDIENFSQDISFETGRDFLDHFCRRLEATDKISSIVLLSKSQEHWWVSWVNLKLTQAQPAFHFNLSNASYLLRSAWNQENLLADEHDVCELLFNGSTFQTIVPLTFDGETVEASLLIGSAQPLKNTEYIAQMIRLFGIRIVREIKQIRIADAQIEQNALLKRQKQQLTQMVSLLGQLDTVADEHEFLLNTATHLRQAFDIRCIDWAFWDSGEWNLLERLDEARERSWFQDAQLITKHHWIKYLERSRRTGEIDFHRGRVRVFWPIGPSEAGYLVAVLTFNRNLPDEELLSFSQNALSLALQGLIQRENLRYQAMRDSLTGLGNRVQLHAWMKVALPTQKHASLLLFDLNRFKEINDSFGHQFGDKLLREIGPRISAQLADKVHYLSRLGGDEFALFFPDTEPAEATKLADVLHASLAESYSIEGLRFQVEASVGVAHFPKHGQDGHELLRCADVAMYAAKNSNRTVVEFNSELDTTTPLRIAVLSELDQALKEGQLWVAYQPLMSTETGQTAGFEALIRWTHPTFGPLSPAEFIPIAEMGEGIRRITEFVLAKTMKYLTQWREIDPSLHVAVNISPRVLLDHQFPLNVERLLEEHKLPGEAIIFELTESTLLVDPIRAVEIIHSLSELGIKVEIDDFGTGYSSLAYLKSLPISALKIDRSFVKDILVDNHNEVIVQSTVQMAHSLGLQTVAEGVEDEATLLKMMRLGCDMIQGYYYAKPIHGKDVANWIKRNV